MVIEKLYGLQATSVTLHDRFTILQTITQQIPETAPVLQSPSSNRVPGYKIRNKRLIEELAHRLERQAHVKKIQHRIGPMRGKGLRRFNSESSLYMPTQMHKAKSSSNLTSIKNRLGPFRGSIGRSSFFGNLGQIGIRSPRARRGRWITGPKNIRGGFHRNFRRARTQNSFLDNRDGNERQFNSSQQTKKSMPTKEQLDQELEQYMAGSKSALDQELDAYMKTIDIDME